MRSWIFAKTVKRIFIFACFSWNPETDKFSERLHICVWHSRLPLLSSQENIPSQCYCDHTANKFPFMYPQKRFSQASLLISTKYFQNRIIMFCLVLGTTYFQMELWNFSRMQEISRIELQRWSFELYISFSKVYIWDWSLANSFWDHILIQISVIDRWIFKFQI